MTQRFSRYATYISILFTSLSFIFSIITRLVYRGPYYPGWDALGPAHGLYLVSTNSFWGALREAFHSVFNFSFWNHTNSLLYTLIPGFLGTMWPWEYWGHLLTFSLFLLTLWFTAKATDLPKRQYWVLLLACGASSAILSYSVAGYPYLTGFLPHALALWIVLDQRIRQSWLLTLVLAIFASALSWNVYELGKTLFVIFLAAAVFFRAIPLQTRAVWVLGAVAQLFLLFEFSHMNVTQFAESDQPAAVIGYRLQYLFDTLFLSQTLDIPVLFVVGVICLFLIRTNRWFFLLLFAFQMALVAWLAMKGEDMLRPRRFLMIDFYSVFMIAALLKDTELSSGIRRVAGPILIVILMAGNVWQTSNLLHYTRTPVQNQPHPLPYTASQADYMVNAPVVNAYQEILSRVNAGEKLILIYNFSHYAENTTDPAALLERLYSSLGHERFVNSVFVFGSQSCRYSCLPVHPMEALGDVLDTIGPAGPLFSDTVTVYYVSPFYHPDNHTFERESAKLFKEIGRRFIVKLDGYKRAGFIPFKLLAKTDDESALPGFCVEPTYAIYSSDIGGDTRPTPFAWLNLPLDVTWVNKAGVAGELAERSWDAGVFSAKIEGVVHVLESGTYDFLLGSDDGAVFTLSGRTLIDNGGAHMLQFQQKSIVLTQGRHPFELRYNDVGGAARLFFDITRPERSGPHENMPPQVEPVRVDQLLPAGLSGRYYAGTKWEGESKEVGPELQATDVLAAEWADQDPGLPRKPFPFSFSLRLEGTLKIDRPGIYLFDLGSDDGSLLYIDGALVADNDGNHAFRSRRAVSYLKQGVMPFRLDYFDAAGNARLKLAVQRVRVSE